METNPATILSGIAKLSTDFTKAVQSRQGLESLLGRKLKDEEYEEYKKQKKTNPDLKKGFSELDAAMKGLKDLSKKMK